MHDRHEVGRTACFVPGSSRTPKCPPKFMILRSSKMNNYVVLNSSEQQKLQIQKSEVEAYDFEPCEVYAASIFMSTGDDKAHTGFTTMYRRLEDAVCNKRSIFVFNIRDWEDKNKTKVGIVECVRHGLLKFGMHGRQPSVRRPFQVHRGHPT
ncbi:hypothetical protein QR680_000946 [Steinernema hermaphroditum]|uniref:Uncharacterized protein n=1 Tax=Steinernema hermaphroditum TaxID=289476 RepID=A0AA39GWF1_9BILA|nr:hypothetical protein QR680_000946 [Steinernema hermaphroditum]